MQNNKRIAAFNNKTIKKFSILLFICSVCFSCSCRKNKLKVDISGIDAPVHIQRFEQDLFSITPDSLAQQVGALEQKYPAFFPLYIEKIMRAGSLQDSSGKYISEIAGFLRNPSIRGLYDTCRSRYAGMKDIEQELNTSFRYLKYYYPDAAVPEVVTFISEFGYGIVTADSLLAIGVDMYLGENYIYYPSIGLPDFMIRRLKRGYIVPNAIKAWGQGMFENKMNTRTLMGQMIYNGKILYWMDALLPDTPDSLKIGFTQQQLDWCNTSEVEIWSFFLENKLLYSTDVTEYHKFINEGPNTRGMPAESPANVGSWVGWQIVRRYMEQNPSVTLQQLMKENDAQKILQRSGYKPRKSFL